MTDSHAFELTVSLGALPGLAQSISARLTPGSPPVTASDLLALARGSKPAELRLSFVFPRDPALSVLAAEHPEQAVSPGSVALAHVFASATVRDAEVDVCFFSTSRALATAMRESGQVRAFFGSLGEHAVDTQVREVNEWHESKPL